MKIKDRKKAFLIVTDPNLIKNAGWLDTISDAYNKSDLKKFIEKIFPSLKDNPNKEKIEEKMEEKARVAPSTPSAAVAGAVGSVAAGSIQKDHLNEMKKILEESEKEVKTDLSLSEKKPDKMEQKELSFQSPIKASYRNVGDFSPGVATDPNHPDGHNGIDFSTGKGTPIYPIARGVVSKIGSFEKSGNCLSILHPEKFLSFYAHCDEIKVREGDKVDLDTVIATVGDTGNAKGRGHHLHLEVKKDGSYINPASLFNFKKIMT